MAIGGIINASFGAVYNLAAGKDQTIIKDFFVGAALAPVGGPMAKLLGKIGLPLIRRFSGMMGRLPNLTLVGGSAAQKLLVSGSRNFFSTIKSYPNVGSTLLGRMLKTVFPKVRWEQHHVWIQQAWSRSAGPGRIFADDAANEGLRRMGNSYLNLIPIPRGLNGALGRSGPYTEYFATAFYSFLVYGDAQTALYLTSVF